MRLKLNQTVLTGGWFNKDKKEVAIKKVMTKTFKRV